MSINQRYHTFDFTGAFVGQGFYFQLPDEGQLRHPPQYVYIVRVPTEPVSVKAETSLGGLRILELEGYIRLTPPVVSPVTVTDTPPDNTTVIE